VGRHLVEASAVNGTTRCVLSGQAVVVCQARLLCPVVGSHVRVVGVGVVAVCLAACIANGLRHATPPCLCAASPRTSSAHAFIITSRQRHALAACILRIRFPLICYKSSARCAHHDGRS
jgi:hypothetical protein